MTSKFYNPIIKVLQANAPQEMGVTDIVRKAGEQNPGLDWGLESSGAVRAMLLRAVKIGGYKIKMVPNSKPPHFFYDDSDKRNAFSQAPLSMPEESGKQPTTFACRSKLYAPALDFLKMHAPKAFGVREVQNYINMHCPSINWSHGCGPVRAMLLGCADRPGSPIHKVENVVPPKFFYSLDEGVPPNPEEQMLAAFSELQKELREELLLALQKMDDEQFERFTNELLSRLGYGQAKTTQKSRDKGIDGMIYGDKLGLRVIRVQAKHYAMDNSVGAPLVQAFIGALQGDDGVFVTTSTFTKDAYEAVEKAHTNSKIALIDGEQLVKHMIDCNFGVQDTGKVFTLKKVDSDFFSDYGVEIP